jgi:hypothetical protein
MHGLDPRIHQSHKSLDEKMDCRVKPGNDEVVVPAHAGEPSMSAIALIAAP